MKQADSPLVKLLYNIISPIVINKLPASTRLMEILAVRACIWNEHSWDAFTLSSTLIQTFNKAAASSKVNQKLRNFKDATALQSIRETVHFAGLKLLGLSRSGFSSSSNQCIVGMSV